MVVTHQLLSTSHDPPHVAKEVRHLQARRALAASTREAIANGFTADCVSPIFLAMWRVLQWVAPSGLLSRVATTTAST